MNRRTFLGAASLATGGLLTAAADAAAADPETTDREAREQKRHLEQLADRDNADRWKYEAAGSTGEFRAPFAQSTIFPEEADGGAVLLSTYPRDNDRVPLSVSTTGDGAESWTGVELSPERAEALAVDLLEYAHEARANTEGGDAE